MYKRLRAGVLITFTILIICIITGCFYDNLTEEVDEPIEEVEAGKVDEPVKINLLATAPKNGGKVRLTGDLRMVFDNAPESVTVEGKPATILGNTAIVKITDLPNVLPDAVKTVIIKWRNADSAVAESKTITFMVLKPVGDLPSSDDAVQSPPATTVAVHPAAGVTISSNQHFTLTFNQSIAAVTVNDSAASGSGHHWLSLPILAKGIVTLKIRWTNRDGSTSSKLVGPYTVDDLGDVGNRDADAPPATTVWIDPAPGATLLPDQLFTLTFNQEVVEVKVDLSPATGSGVNWTARPILPTRSEMRQTLKLIVESSNRVPTQLTEQGRRRRQDLAAGRIHLAIWWRNKNGSTGFKSVGPYTVAERDANSIPPPAKTVTVNPALGSTVLLSQQFTLTFDQEVVRVTVNGKSAAGSRLVWTAEPRLVEGTAMLEIEWTNRDGSTGSKLVGPYTVKKPDTTSPAIVKGTVKHGEAHVNLAQINASGFRFDFNEVIRGTIKLTNETGVSLNWVANVRGKTATLTPVAGRKLANATIYKIEIDVRDDAGNRTRKTIVFVTKNK